MDPVFFFLENFMIISYRVHLCHSGSILLLHRKTQWRKFRNFARIHLNAIYKSVSPFLSPLWINDIDYTFSFDYYPFKANCYFFSLSIYYKRQWFTFRKRIVKTEIWADQLVFILKICEIYQNSLFQSNCSFRLIFKKSR